MVAPSLNQRTWCLACSATLLFFSISHHHLLLFSMRFGHMAVHVEVPGDFRQGELHAFKLWREKDLASQPGVLLKHGRHVQHVILPRAPRYVNIFSCIPFTSSHTSLNSNVLVVKEYIQGSYIFSKLKHFSCIFKLFQHTYIFIYCAYCI